MPHYYTLYLNSENTTGATPSNNTSIISKSSTSDITYLVDYDALFRDNEYDEYKLASSFLCNPVANSSTSGNNGVLTLGLANQNRSNISNVILGHLDPIAAVPVPTITYVSLGNGTVTAFTAETSSVGARVTAPVTNTGVGDYVRISTVNPPVYYKVLSQGGANVMYLQGNPPINVSDVLIGYRRIITTTPQHFYAFDTTANPPDQIPRLTGKQYLTVKAQNYKQDSTVEIGEYSLKLVFECKNTHK